MPSNYTGNPTATQAPGLKPGPGVDVIESLPADATDDINAASVAQAFKVCADKLAALDSNQAAVFYEPWQVADVTHNSDQAPIPTLPTWNFDEVVDASFSLTNGGGARATGIDTGAVSAQGILCTAFPLFTVQTDSILCWEGVIFPNWVNDHTIRAGLAAAQGNAGFMVNLSKVDTDPNWFVNGDGSYHDTGIAAVAGDPLAVKMLWDAGAGTIDWFLNGSGTPQVSLTAAAPAVVGQPVFLQAYVASGATGGSLAGFSWYDQLLRWTRF